MSTQQVQEHKPDLVMVIALSCRTLPNTTNTIRSACYLPVMHSFTLLFISLSLALLDLALHVSNDVRRERARGGGGGGRGGSGGGGISGGER